MSHPAFPHISQFFIHSPMYCVSKINGIVSLIHQSLYCSVIFWVSLAPEVRFLLSYPIFFFTCLGGNLQNMVEKNLLHEKGGKTQAFKISVSRFILLEKKRNNFIRSRCWHCVSYWRWREFTRTIAVTKGYWRH